MSTQAPVSPLFAPGPENGLTPALMQAMVDEAATLNFYSRQAGGRDPAIRVGGDRITGFRIEEELHRFEVVTYAPTGETPLRARNAIGERVATFKHRWMFAPDDDWASPGAVPPETVFDPWSSQRFAMLDSECWFLDSDDGFQGFGAGRTMPGKSKNGEHVVLVTAVGTILKGFGRFQGLEEATYVYCGTLSAKDGFRGNVLLRAIDRETVFATESDLRDIDVQGDLVPDATYILFRGEAVPTDSVTPSPTGLVVEQGLRLYNVDFQTGGGRGIRTSERLGPWIGKITANINFDPSYPGGSALNPIPFTNKDGFLLHDNAGRNVGSFSSESSEGRVFLTRIAGQTAIRFGGVGAILGGSGLYEGLSGLMTDNSLVVFNPHVSASVYVLRIDDPEGRYRV